MGEILRTGWYVGDLISFHGSSKLDGPYGFSILEFLKRGRFAMAYLPVLWMLWASGMELRFLCEGFGPKVVQGA